MMNEQNVLTTKAMAAIALAMTMLTTTVGAQDLHWVRQMGTAVNDAAMGVDVDNSGNVYIGGYSQGSLAGPSAGDWDMVLAKFDASGTMLWTRQLGTAERDWAFDVAVDSAGNAYVTGWTEGSLGGPFAGRDDTFLVKYDASGTLLWKRQIGTSGHDRPFSVAVSDAGHVFITGYLTDSGLGPMQAFLTMFDDLGTQRWMRQVNTSGEAAGGGVAVDRAGNAYITGITTGNVGGPNAGGYDVFLAKYNASGNQLWTRQVGTPADEWGNGVAVDRAGSAYITGRTMGSLAAPNPWGDDAFLIRYDASGTRLWTRQIGGIRGDRGNDVAVDSAGNAYITGETGGDPNGPFTVSNDFFVAKYNALGTLLWTRQLVATNTGSGTGVAVDSAGDAYVTGYTRGDHGGPSAGGEDIFLAKFGDTCYADCDQSTGAGVLDIFDFLCFQNSFVNSEPYACDCDTSTGPGVCDVFDFLCFQDSFVGGCP